jgi:hypothetical protein
MKLDVVWRRVVAAIAVVILCAPAACRSVSVRDLERSDHAIGTSRVESAADGGGTPAPFERLELAQGVPDVRDLKLHNRVIAAQVGVYATPAPGQAGAFNGADLGWTFEHRDKLWVLFGDSWFLDPVNAAGLPDDALGQISLTDFPDGASVDAFVAAHPAPNGQPAWRAAGPTMPVSLQNGAGPGFAPIMNTRDGKPIRSGIGFVPIAGFSNGHDDAGEGVFAIFNSYEQVACRSGRCDDGFECDAQLGTSTLEFLSPPCVVGSTAACAPGPGMCQNRASSLYDESSQIARTLSVVVRNDVGFTTPDDPIHFKSQPWETLDFLNATARTVTDFDPARAHGEGDDYTPALGNALPRSGVFVWGRPQFGGIGAEGRDAQLYLAWAPMPVPEGDGHFAWEPQYFAGVDSDGRPQFTAREVDAHPLDLDADTPGEQPEEVRDVVGQMGISWVPSLKRFIMFYGGEGAAMFGNAIFRSDAGKVRHDPEGSLFVRFAEHPWGPWTAPRPFMAGGDRSDSAQPTGQYAPGGILAHDRCFGSGCARYDPAYRLDLGNNNNGALYGPSIVDVWTTARGDETDLYWFLSTWNPYQVVLVKTTLSL